MITMSVAKVVINQYFNKVNQAVKVFGKAPPTPPEGWLRTVRTALGMSGVQLASRLGVTKMRVSRAEHDELSGSLTLKTMHNMANAMGCKFIYAVIPPEKVEEVLKKQALKRAKAKVNAAAIHMALEDQSLNEKQLRLEIKRVADQMLEDMSSDLWGQD